MSIRQLIADLGGPTAVVRGVAGSALSPGPINRNAVAMWVKRDKIPPSWRAAVARLCVDAGIEPPWRPEYTQAAPLLRAMLPHLRRLVAAAEQAVSLAKAA